VVVAGSVKAFRCEEEKKKKRESGKTIGDVFVPSWSVVRHVSGLTFPRLSGTKAVAVCPNRAS
jgi:hypothetical protein